MPGFLEASISKYDSLAFLLFCGLNSFPTRLHLFTVARTDRCNHKNPSWYTLGQGIFSNDLFQWCSFYPVSNAHSILESPIQFTGLIHLFVFQKHFPTEPEWHNVKFNLFIAPKANSKTIVTQDFRYCIYIVLCSALFLSFVKLSLSKLIDITSWSPLMCWEILK